MSDRPKLPEGAQSFAMWWGMVEAERELAGEPIPDDATVLHFMGSGASTMVTAKDLRELFSYLALMAGDGDEAA